MTEAHRIHDANKNRAAEAQYELDSEAGVLSEFETCSLCTALVRDDELSDTPSGRLCKDCVDTLHPGDETIIVRGR